MRAVVARIGLVASLCLAGVPAQANDRDTTDLADLSLEELSNIKVTSVSRREEPLGEAAAAIYVITAEQIQRSGAATLQEALRLAPNLHVARADANQYAISARGFNSVLANKMLVLIDGRTIYSPLFSGVFWEAQHVVLEDIDRIEVISGPGGTAWGTNAMNGVINVITKPARETQGVMVAGGAGSAISTVLARIGMGLGATGHIRVDGRSSWLAESERADGTGVGDDATRAIGNFRADWGDSVQTLSLIGGVMHSDISQGALDDRVVENTHVIANWDRQFASGHGLRVQAYYDRSTRDQPGSIDDVLDTWDIELFHQLPVRGGNDILWGGGYRYQRDRLDNLGPALAFIPADRNLEYPQIFAQDRFRLADNLHLTAGIRAERNVYTQWEYLPNVRLAWQVRPERLLWGSWSRAVRAPSRIDRELFSPASPAFFALAGGPDFNSEIANVGEIGYRAEPSAKLSYSITGFIQDYTELRSYEPSPAGPVFRNGLEATSTGGEAWLTLRPKPWWDVMAGWTELRLQVATDQGVTNLPGNSPGNDPNHWGTLRTSFSLRAKHHLDVWARYVGALPSPQVPDYTSINARIGVMLFSSLEVSVAGLDLFDASHAEWGVAPVRPEFEPSVYAYLRWQGWQRF
jgi:iron complex outermembrane receptor protein